MQYASFDLGFDRSMVSKGSLDVVSKLREAGYDGYLVGGCVRDLLLGVTPKDFDVTTNATPEQVKSVFPRGRIIGRRFKIVHVRYGREIVEVSTYRAAPKPIKKSWFGFRSRKSAQGSGRIRDDNVFGTLEDDVMRRDFTVNAIYYDPVDESVLDFVDGVGDAGAGRLSMIGDVSQRFIEDPVRMLRVIRFEAKLDLAVDENIRTLLVQHVGLLSDVPPARLFDEVLKLFHHSYGVATWMLLKHYGVLNVLFPLCFERDEPHNEAMILAALENTDRRISQGKPVIPSFLFAALLWWPFKEKYDNLLGQGVPGNEAIWVAADDIFATQSRRVSVPRRVSTPAIEIWSLQARLEQRRPRVIDRLLENRRFRAAYDFMLLRQVNGEVDESLARWWTEIQELGFTERRKMIRALSPNRSHRSSGKKQGASMERPGGADIGNASDSPAPGKKRRRRPRKRRPKQSGQSD